MKELEKNILESIKQIKQVFEDLDIEDLYDFLTVRYLFGAACG